MTVFLFLKTSIQGDLSFFQKPTNLLQCNGLVGVENCVENVNNCW